MPGSGRPKSGENRGGNDASGGEMVGPGTEKTCGSAERLTDKWGDAGREAIAEVAAPDLVVLDEAGVNQMTPWYAWVPRGERALAPKPTNHRTNLTIIEVMRLDEVMAAMGAGSVNRWRFRSRKPTGQDSPVLHLSRKDSQRDLDNQCDCISDNNFRSEFKLSFARTFPFEVFKLLI